VERERELQQDGAEFARVEQRIESGAHQLFILRSSVCLVRELLPHFCGEDKTRILCCVADPVRGELGLQRLVKRSVDFNRIEKLREESDFVEIARMR